MLEKMDRESLENNLHEDIWKCLWVNGFGNPAMMRKNALEEIERKMDTLVIPDDNDNPISIMSCVIQKIIYLSKISERDYVFACDDDGEMWDLIKDNWLYDDSDNHLPIPVY